MLIFYLYNYLISIIKGKFMRYSLLTTQVYNLIESLWLRIVAKRKESTLSNLSEKQDSTWSKFSALAASERKTYSAACFILKRATLNLKPRLKSFYILPGQLKRLENQLGWTCTNTIAYSQEKSKTPPNFHTKIDLILLYLYATWYPGKCFKIQSIYLR